MLLVHVLVHKVVGKQIPALQRVPSWEVTSTLLPHTLWQLFNVASFRLDGTFQVMGIALDISPWVATAAPLSLFAFSANAEEALT